MEVVNLLASKLFINGLTVVSISVIRSGRECIDLELLLQDFVKDISRNIYHCIGQGFLLFVT